MTTTTPRTLDILSLGAGVQSSALLLLSCRGELPRLDAAIFADTGWEPREVYAHLEWLKVQAADAGIPLHVVTKGNIREDALVSMVRGTKDKKQRWVSMPYYTREGSSVGMMQRQCTKEYKIEVIDRAVRRDVLGLQPRQPVPRDVHVRRWMGISLDEVQRTRESRDRWATNVYPLIGLPVGGAELGRPWRRSDCIAWLKKNYPDRGVPRSACIGCPFHSNAEWRRLRDESPDEWADAVDFDRRIRKCGGMRGDVFLHRSATPLDQAPIDGDDRQPSLFDSLCEGNCGV